jgi:predicted nucleic acid-binding protein
MTMRLLDSNVWLAAINADEEDHAPARRLIEGSIARPLAALDLTLYEVANVAMKRWRSPARAREVATLVRDACPKRISRLDSELLERAIVFSTEHKLTVYDAAYVAAAELNGWTLVSGDHADLVEPGLAITAEQALAAGY